MKRLLLAFAAAVALASAPAIAADHLMLLGVSNVTGGIGYVPPAVTSSYIIAGGDSRTQDSGGASWVIGSPSTYSTGTTMNAYGYAGWLGPLSGGSWMYNYGWNYGVGATTSANLTGRLALATPDCNDSGNMSGACFSGTKTTMASAASGSPIATLSLNYVSGDAMATYVCPGATCPLIGPPGGQNNYACQATAVTGSGNPYTVTIPASCGWTSISNGAGIALTLASKASNFAAYLGPSGSGGNINDIDGNMLSGSGYSPITDPAQLAFILNSVNDASLNTASITGSISGTTLTVTANPTGVLQAGMYISTASALFGTYLNHQIDATHWAVSQSQTVTSQALSLVGSHLTSIANLRADIVAMGPANANKILILADEVPTGLAQSYSALAASADTGDPEVVTPASQTCTNGASYTGVCATVTKSSVWFDTQVNDVWFAPATTSALNSQFVAGANDGLALSYCNAACWTANSGLPASGHNFADYASAPATIPKGVYVFNSGDIGTRVAVNYRYTNQAHGLWFAANHDWIAAAASSGNPCAASGTFIGATSGLMLPAPAANCPSVYPWVHVALTWEATVDTTVTDANGKQVYPKPYVSRDGLHFYPYGSALIAKAMLAAVPAGVTPPNPSFQPATASMTGVRLSTATTSSATTNYSSSACNTTAVPGLAHANSTGPQRNYTLSAVAPIAAGLYHVGDSVYTTEVASGLPSYGGHIACIDVTGGYLLLDVAATSTQTPNNSIYTLADPANNIIPWGVMDYANGVSSSATALTGFGCSGTCSANIWTAAQISALPGPTNGKTVKVGIPAQWGVVNPDASTMTAIGNGTLGFGFGVEQNPLGDGFDDFMLVLSGYAGTTATNQLTFSVGLPAPSFGADAGGEIYRASCEMLAYPGPNGRLTGLAGLKVSLQEIVAAGNSFVPPGIATAGFTYWTGGAGFSNLGSLAAAFLASGQPGYDATLGAIRLNLVTGPVVQKAPGGVAGHSLTFSFTATWRNKDPVSGVLRVRKCRAWRVGH